MAYYGIKDNHDLAAWADDVKHRAMFHELSEHDALIELMESTNDPLTEHECIKLMDQLGSYWD